nr:hypothetical protein [Coprococcus sp. AF21-14LB]
MMKLVLAYYDNAVEALKNGAPLNDLINLAVRERIGRYKYTHEDQIEEEYKKVSEELHKEIANTLGKEDF